MSKRSCLDQAWDLRGLSGWGGVGAEPERRVQAEGRLGLTAEVLP